MYKRSLYLRTEWYRITVIIKDPRSSESQMCVFTTLWTVDPFGTANHLGGGDQLRGISIGCSFAEKKGLIIRRFTSNPSTGMIPEHGFQKRSLGR